MPAPRRRWLARACAIVTGAAALAFAGAATSPAHVPAGAGAELLPDLDAAAPAQLSLKKGGPGRARELLLSFASAAANVGSGALVVEGRRRSVRDATMDVSQIVLLADRSTRSVHVRGVLRYVRSRTHGHWHYVRFMRYELRRADDGTLVAPDRKSGFCLGDRYRLDRRVANAPPRAVWRTNCGRNRPRLLRLWQGISVGYGDDYKANREGQSLDVTTLSEGRYVLVNRVNPDRNLRESEYANNASSTLFELTRGRGKRAPLRLDVLRSCPDSDTCG